MAFVTLQTRSTTVAFVTIGKEYSGDWYLTPHTPRGIWLVRKGPNGLFIEDFTIPLPFRYALPIAKLIIWAREGKEKTKATKTNKDEREFWEWADKNGHKNQLPH